jgi:hypothetical protein
MSVVSSFLLHLVYVGYVIEKVAVSLADFKILRKSSCEIIVRKKD